MNARRKRRRDLERWRKRRTKVYGRLVLWDAMRTLRLIDEAVLKMFWHGSRPISDLFE